jgi:hypothetical protein
MVVEEVEKKEQQVQQEVLELVQILILLLIVEVAQDVLVGMLKVVVGVLVNVLEGRFVTGGETVGGKHLLGLTIELVPELMVLQEELVVQVVTEDLGGVIIMQGL